MKRRNCPICVKRGTMQAASYQSKPLPLIGGNDTILTLVTSVCTGCGVHAESTSQHNENVRRMQAANVDMDEWIRRIMDSISLRRLHP